MYKVFIDQCPVVFINFENRDEKKNYYWIDELNFDELQLVVEKKDESTEIIVCCRNLKLEFESFFAGFERRIASGGIVMNDRGHVLMIQREGFWDFPKGHVDPGEHLEETAVREVEEECGITDPIIGSFLIRTYHTYIYKGINVLKECVWFDMKYSGDESLVGQSEEGITDVRWCEVDFVRNQLGRTFGSINELILFRFYPVGGGKLQGFLK